MGVRAGKTIRHKGALKAKGRATRAAILDTAHEVFKVMGFYGSSISEIARRCGYSKGTFYQYFKNKDQIFQELNDLIITRFLEKVESVSFDGLGFEERLRKVLQILYSHCKENLAFHTILGESELLDSVTIAYYESIRRPLAAAAHAQRLGLVLHPGAVVLGGVCRRARRLVLRFEVPAARSGTRLRADDLV